MKAISSYDKIKDINELFIIINDVHSLEKFIEQFVLYSIGKSSSNVYAWVHRIKNEGYEKIFKSSHNEEEHSITLMKSGESIYTGRFSKRIHGEECPVFVFAHNKLSVKL